MLLEMTMILKKEEMFLINFQLLISICTGNHVPFIGKSSTNRPASTVFQNLNLSVSGRFLNRGVNTDDAVTKNPDKSHRHEI
jgi:hypothetical protein